MAVRQHGWTCTQKEQRFACESAGVPPLEGRAAMGHAAFAWLRSPACARNVRQDQPEHHVPLETEHTSRTTARQEKFGVTRRDDTAERAHHAVSDVLLTIGGLVREWLDAEGHDARPGCSWMERLLRGMRLSYKMPTKCVEKLHSPEGSTPTRTGC